MSAIAGIFHLNDEPINLEHGRNLMEALEKFPADDIQTWHMDKIFLGCHAQWITPESIDELLPYYDYERQLAITADAIIDNREELFEKLQVDRALQKSISDSELILLAYEKWGEDSPKFLVGDFAYMIWDGKEQKLFGARDFSGSRTLYYFYDQKRFAFSTVIHPLFSLPYINKKLNEQWLAEFLAIPDMFDTVNVFSSIYKNISQLPPSHSVSVFNGQIKLTRYCTFNDIKTVKLKSNAEYEEAFRYVFKTSVTSLLRSNRKIGAHLSGGLDSGSVVSIAAKALGKERKKLHTFSYVPISNFQDWTSRRRMADESPLIKETVNYVGNIQDYFLDFNGKSSLSEMDDWLEILEMPYKFFENSFWLKGIFEKASQEGIGLLLNGSRGNYSISWGPAIDYYAILLKRLRWIRLVRELKLYSNNIGVGKKRVLEAIGTRAFPFLDRISSPKPENDFPMLINPELAKRTNVFAFLQPYGIDISGTHVPNAVERRKKPFEDLHFWNSNGTSRTKLSLRYSLWDRDPTNDLRLIRFCLSVPVDQFVHDGLDRALIRKAMIDYLPDKVRLNQNSRGFQAADGVNRMIPVWNLFLEELEQLCKDSAVSVFLNISAIKNAINKIGREPRPEYILDPDYKILMRALIVSRFIKNFT